nr:hypothetical protein [Methylomarinum sp. Ch1-1]MDP4521325.1 hypothetical protein [Methylomarinum sp. Ch1-1]
MAGFYGQRLALAAPVGGFPPHLSPSPDTVESISGGYSESTGETAMVNHVQNPPKIPGKSQSKFDLFKHVSGVKTLVCRGLSSSQIQALLPELQGRYGLKFIGMMEG